jgi:hypothetical protein
LSFNVVDMWCWVCVEENGRRAPDVGCCTQHGSQHGRNIVATWGEEGGSLLMFGCCTQHGSQHGPWTFYFNVAKVYFECSEKSFLCCKHNFGCCEAFPSDVRVLIRLFAFAGRGVESWIVAATRFLFPSVFLALPIPLKLHANIWIRQQH